MGKRSIDSLAEYARSPLNIIIGLRLLARVWNNVFSWLIRVYIINANLIVGSSFPTKNSILFETRSSSKRLRLLVYQKEKRG